MKNRLTLSFLYLLLLISPFGAPLFYILFSIFDFCNGALGSGIRCTSITLVPSYFESIGGFLEISMIMLGAGFFWFIYSISILIKLIRVIIFGDIELEKNFSVGLFLSSPLKIFSVRIVYIIIIGFIILLLSAAIITSLISYIFY